MRRKQEDCALRCCDREELLEEARWGWRCRRDSRGNWSPQRSSFLDRETPTGSNTLNRASSTSRRVTGEADELLRFARHYSHDFLFAYWRTCTDFQRSANGTLEEVVLYIEHSRVTRGVYWLLRTLCCVSVLLLAAALGAIACNRSLRRKVHGWCLACHAACLLGFNLGHVLYYLTISDVVDEAEEIPPPVWKSCKTFAFSLYFLLTAANCWMTVICVNLALGFRKLQVVRPAGGGGVKKFLALSAFAWSLSALMTVLCLFARPDDFNILYNPPWYTPMLTETRVCFDDVILTGDSKALELKTQKSGTALFYYGPLCALVAANVACQASILRSVRFLRRGNSVLRSEEDVAARGIPGAEGDRPRAAWGEAAVGGGGGGAAQLDANTIRLYVKLLLMTGVVELTVEMIAWATSYHTKGNIWADHRFSYRAAGYVTDCFRAAVIVWLTAPDGGYFRSLCCGKEQKGAACTTRTGQRQRRS